MDKGDSNNKIVNLGCLTNMPFLDNNAAVLWRIDTMVWLITSFIPLHDSIWNMLPLLWNLELDGILI